MRSSIFPPVFRTALRGLVPGPTSTDVSSQRILRADGVWVDQPDTLPSVTGNSGRLLTNNGTVASWTPAFTIDAVSGAAAVTAQGSNQNITLTPSGTGFLQVNGSASVTGSLGVSAPDIASAYGNIIGLGNTSGFPTLGSGQAAVYGNGTLGLVLAGNGSAGSVTVTTSAGATIGQFSSTGLAVTGSLSATSLTTITSDSSANALFLLGRSSDNISQLQFRNNANNAIYGIVQGTSAGGGTVNLLAQGATGTVDLYVDNTLRASVNGTGLAVTGTVSDTAGNVRLIPQNSQSAAYTLALTDSGKHILHPSADTTARTFTIPANSSVAFSIGTAITFVNQNGAGTLSIAITTDTMRLAGAGTTGTRTLAANGVATAVKITSTEWIISGTGLT